MSPKARLSGPRVPRMPAGRPGRRRPAVTPRSRRTNSATPPTIKAAPTSATSATGSQSYCADQRDVVGRPAERAEDGQRDRVASTPLAQPQHRPSRSQATPAAPARPSTRGQQRTRGHRRPSRSTRSRGRTRAPTRARSGRPAASSPNTIEPAEAARARISIESHSSGQVRGQLLDRDPPLAERRGGDEVQAAAPGLAGERATTGRGSTTARCRSAKMAPYFQVM